MEHRWPRAWQKATNFTDVPLRLTQEEANQLSDDLDAVLARYRRHDPTRQPGSAGVPADAVIVAAQYQVFPEPEQVPPDPDDL